MHDRSLFWLGTATSMKKNRVVLVSFITVVLWFVIAC